jgi:hypothetical protein
MGWQGEEDKLHYTAEAGYIHTTKNGRHPPERENSGLALSN